MIPLLVFLLAGAAVYLATIDAAFSGLMRLSLRLLAERSARQGSLGEYLDDPMLLFGPVRLLLALVTALATVLLARSIGLYGPQSLALVMVSVVAFIGVFEIVIPMLIAGRDPDGVLDRLLPSFRPVSRVLAPIARRTFRSGARRPAPAPTEDVEPVGNEASLGYSEDSTRPGIIAGEERRLLQSIVDFGDTLVREIMTPRPDIVAITDTATIGELRSLFREQEYSRFPVYKDNLDNIAGFVFVKDLVGLAHWDERSPITPLLRPAVIVPESKRVAELLKQFQRQQTQIAVVVDEYGGTAGLVTLEDMLEEIVGEIRDEYDVEAETIVDEGNGRFVFSGKVDIDEVAKRLNVQIEREGFETLGGFLLSHLGRVPSVGEAVDIDGLHVEVLEVDRRRVSKVRMTRIEAAAPEGERTA